MVLMARSEIVDARRRARATEKASAGTLQTPRPGQPLRSRCAATATRSPRCAVDAQRKARTLLKAEMRRSSLVLLRHICVAGNFIYRLVPSCLRMDCEILADLVRKIGRGGCVGDVLLFQFLGDDFLDLTVADGQAIGLGKQLIIWHDLRDTMLFQFPLDEGDQLIRGESV